MSISIHCGDCGKQMNVADQWAGKRAKCKNCGNVIQIPGPAVSLPPKLPRPTAGLAVDHSGDQPETFRQPVKESNMLILAISGGVVLLLLIGFTIVHFLNSAPGKAQADSERAVAAAPAAPGAVSSGDSATPQTPLLSSRPNFPDLPVGLPASRARFLVYPMTITGTGPGLPMHVRLYLPKGRLDLHSLPCVFIAPAGTRMIYGGTLGDSDSPEHIPYCVAGFAVLAYELSGDLPGNHEAKITYGSMKAPVQQFMAADGGLANARLAVDFVLAKVPQVDPQQLFAAGHSSAATMALNAVESDHRFRAVAAYAPRCDVVAHWSANIAQMNRVVPGAADLTARVSPILHVNDIACPVFLFHADDDSRVPLADNVAYAQALQSVGKTVQFERVPTGDHYDSMIRQGIPGGIKFFIENGAHPLPSTRPEK